MLGTGGAGLTAALTAAAAGADGGDLREGRHRRRHHRGFGRHRLDPRARPRTRQDLTVDDAMAYLRAQSFGSMDEELVETFVRTGPAMLDFVEAHSDMRFEIATGFPDYKPELPGGRPGGGRSLSAAPYDLNRDSRSGATGSRRFPPTSATSVSTPRPGPGCTPTSTTTPVTSWWPAPR